ncbi:MAG: hypothetical protein KDB60_05605 [Propionibacteriaceae bacterium]|nr:hypothetical protein [Propionibacteriaceae bacterium]
MTAETFKRVWWRGWVRSSEGYAVRVMGRNDLQYTDNLGLIHVFVEPMADWRELAVDTSTIPDSLERPREEVLSRIRRVFDFNGWVMIQGSG